MATFWSGSVALMAGQVAITECTALRNSGDTCALQLHVDTPAVQLTYTFMGDGVEGVSNDSAAILSIEAVNGAPLPSGFLRVKFTAVQDCVAGVEWRITEGDADLAQPSISIE